MPAEPFSDLASILFILLVLSKFAFRFRCQSYPTNERF